MRLHNNVNTALKLIHAYLVGITLGVLVLFIVGGVLLLIFAKSTERWCFADDAYQYRDPQDKRRPPSHAQVYRFKLTMSHTLFKLQVYKMFYL